jgi:NTE family protein
VELLTTDPEPDTADATEKYRPRPKAERRGLALCLSGGGFRAALFHLGGLRRLNELGILAKLDAISSVSGGSIIAAHLADRLRPWPTEPLLDFESRVAAPFRTFTSRNLRTKPILKRGLPWNWFRSSTGVKALARAYEKRLTQLRLTDLPERPLFVINATDMAFGVNWIFERKRIGSYQAGYLKPAPSWPLARAVAASSCFPPIFNPLPVGLRPDELKGGKAQGPGRDEAIQGLRLTDGGNYDNLGLEPVWKTAKVLLVSDGGSTFDASPDRSLIWRLSRYTDILNNQVGAVRKRWLIASFITSELEGTYWGNASLAANYKPNPPDGYSKELVETIISDIRTDMDAFSEPEQKVLENHGYILAEAAVRCHAAALPIPGTLPFRVPHPEWIEESKVREALRDSHKRKLPFGRR